MKVSIIIPIYNSENYLDKCIRSAVGQTYDDVEIILVNDGSTDRTEEICHKYEEEDPRIIFISQKNAGVSVARNTGLDASNGELIAFIDSDDYVESDYIEYLVDIMELNGSDISCCQYEESNRSEETPRKLEGAEECLREYLISNEISVSMCCKLFRKQLFDGIRFPEGKRFEDNYTLYKLIDRCSSVTIGYQTKYHYIDHPESFVHGGYSQEQYDIVDASLQQRVFIEEKHPSLTRLANSRVIYAVNRCLINMADSGVYDDDRIEQVKPLYKSYSKDFLHGPSGKSAKRFCRIARISPKAAIRIYQMLVKKV